MTYSAEFSSSSEIKERVDRVMNYKKTALWVSAAAVVLCIAAVTCFMIAPASTPAGNEKFSYDDLENSNAASSVKIWNEQQIKSAFMEKISESKPQDEITIIDCTAVTDNVYDTVGAVLYRLSSQPEVIETAFVKSDGFFQTCGTYAQVCDKPELTYLGNGTVVFKAVRENGEMYGYTLTFSQSDDEKNTHFKAEEQEVM